MRHDAIPSFFLYGEAPQAVGDRFLHLEALDDRSRPNNWNIRPHAHANLNHVFFIENGGGAMTADARSIPFQAPCLLLVPAGTVHGFAFEVDTCGTVLTISEAYRQEIVRREAEFRGLFQASAGVPLGQPQLAQDCLERLGRELAWTAPGHAAAVEALLVTLFVEILRLRQASDADAPPAHGAQAALVARFREMVEVRYKSGAPMETYAEALAAHPKRLRTACLSVAGATPRIGDWAEARSRLGV